MVGKADGVASRANCLNETGRTHATEIPDASKPTLPRSGWCFHSVRRAGIEYPSMKAFRHPPPPPPSRLPTAIRLPAGQLNLPEKTYDGLKRPCTSNPSRSSIGCQSRVLPLVAPSLPLTSSSCPPPPPPPPGPVTRILLRPHSCRCPANHWQNTGMPDCMQLSTYTLMENANGHHKLPTLQNTNKCSQPMPAPFWCEGQRMLQMVEMRFHQPVAWQADWHPVLEGHGSILTIQPPGG